MEFHQLEAFVAVVDSGSFSRAAEDLYLSQPTVSGHIKTLEKEIGTPLFDRGKNTLKLTPTGKVLYRHARDILSLREKASAEITGAEVVGKEVITVSASSVPCQYLLPKAVAAFEQDYPLVTVLLKQDNSRRVCEDVFQYRCPLGVVGEKHRLPRLHYTPILADQLVAAIPKRDDYAELLAKDALTVNDLKDYKLLLREPGSGTRALFEQELISTGMNLEMFQAAVFDNQETIKQAVRHGLGITVISKIVIEDYLKFGLLEFRPFSDLKLKRSFYLVHHEKRVLTPATKVLQEFLISFNYQEGEEV